MDFLVVFLSVLGLALFADGFIRKHGAKLHFITYLLACFIIVYELFFFDKILLPDFLIRMKYILGRGFLSVSLFILIMYAGAMNPKNPYTKKLLGLRYEFSILASTLFLTHTIPQIFHFEQYIPMMKSSVKMNIIYHFIALSAIACLILILPLWITSYKGIRKKMKAKNWKKLHRLAYLIYALIYLHVSAVFLCLPHKQVEKFVIYSAIFGGYLVLRVRKVVRKGKI